MKFAAIDIGSNAIRLLFYNVFEDGPAPAFRKVSLTRLPIRLGEDVFAQGRIGENKIQKLIKSMIAFRNLMDVHEVAAYKAYATSAMREADNGLEVIQRVYTATGIEINIIDGNTEASVIHSNRISEKFDGKNGYLYIDVGGGSTEISFFGEGILPFSGSYKLGTVRILAGSENKDEWQRLKDDIRKIRKKWKGEIIGIGSGGNINRIFKMSGLKEGKPMSVKRLKELHEQISGMTYDERTHILGLNTDRADVIVPAGEIYLFVCKQADIKTMMVPKIGLSDGIIKELYREYLTRSASAN